MAMAKDSIGNPSARPRDTYSSGVFPLDVSGWQQVS